LRSSNGGDVGNADMSLHVLATTASSVHAAHDLELAFDLKWTSRMDVLVSVLKAMARCVTLFWLANAITMVLPPAGADRAPVSQS